MVRINVLHKSLLQPSWGYVHHARMLTFKSKTSIHPHNQKHFINVRQPVRYGAKEKQQRTKAQIHAEQKRRQEAKNKIPVTVIPHIMKISDIIKTTGRTKSQVLEAKASCERVSFVEQRDYPLEETLCHPLLSCVMKSMGFRVEYQNSSSTIIAQDKDIYAKPVSTDPSHLQSRPPVVAVMGHVDHGKTTVLDALRNTSIAKNEAGGITQSIGAFSVSFHSDYTVTFLDTPGHSVFTSMRERGAQVADIVLLMVAADDGVMEQTVESINMIKMADTPVVVAINKCDKSDAAPEMVIEDLDSHGIKCEDIGGDVPAVKISALMKKGLDDLIQTLVATAELHSMKCDPNMQLQGFVLESQMVKGRGNICSVIIKQGILKVLVAGNSMAKVKAIMDTKGRKVKSLCPGEAGSVMGWKTLPSSGQLVLQAETEAQAKDALRYREKEMKILASEEISEEIMKKREEERREYQSLREEYASKKHRKAESYRVALEKNKHCESVPVLNILIKGDVDGSMDAIMKIVNSYDCEDECVLNVVSHGVGPLKSSEYEFAKELQACIFLFNTDASASFGDEVVIVKHDVIYHFVKSLKDKLNEKLPTVEKYISKGEAMVLEVFKKKKLVIAGSRVISGMLDAKDTFVLERDGIELHKGLLSSMRQHAVMLSKVTAGNECGVVFEDDLECGIEIGDTLRCVTVTQEKQETSWQPHGF